MDCVKCGAAEMTREGCSGILHPAKHKSRRGDAQAVLCSRCTQHCISTRTPAPWHEIKKEVLEQSMNIDTRGKHVKKRDDRKEEVFAQVRAEWAGRNPGEVMDLPMNVLARVAAAYGVNPCLKKKEGLVGEVLDAMAGHGDGAKPEPDQKPETKPEPGQRPGPNPESGGIKWL